MATCYYVNLNYVCNERCVFCVADLDHVAPLGGRPWVTLDDVSAWVADAPPGPDDQVVLSGGEPTLHRELVPIVQLLGAHCPRVAIYSNGLRLADRAFARDTVEAGISHFQIALFGAEASTHEAVTQLPGSFERTLEALAVLGELRPDHEFVLEVRLLFSRQTHGGNPEIVRLLHRRVPGIDAISLNRVNLSRSAARSDAPISWADARASVNESARRVRELGYELRFQGIPFCVFEGDNAAFVRAETTRWAARVAAGVEPRSWEHEYLDPALLGNVVAPAPPPLDPVLPAPCVSCDYASACERVPDWYVRRYGHAGLRPVRLGGAGGAGAGVVEAASRT